ncbi:MAG TPA: hypothetical protein PLX14_11955, partial [Anaerolineales bacterium]|nr:hypothetical protein [Anaerolineales bacterium]
EILQQANEFYLKRPASTIKGLTLFDLNLENVQLKYSSENSPVDRNDIRKSLLASTKRLKKMKKRSIGSNKGWNFFS